MGEEFEYNGIWWLPDKPEKQVSGILRFTPDEGANLDLIGSFKDTENMNITLKPEIILGVSSDGENITLHKCLETRSTIGLQGFQTSSRFSAKLVFVGVHFQTSEDINFKSISVHYLYLDEWVNISGFDIESAGKKEVIIKYKLPEPFQAEISSGFKISINFRAAQRSFSFVPKEVTIKQNTEIKIETSEEKLFEDFREIMYHIQNFLTLGTTKPVYPLTITGLTEVNKKIIEDKVYYPTVKIFYQLSDIPKRHKIFFPNDMLFTFKDISDRFELLLKNWFEKKDFLEPVCNLYFGTFYNPRMYIEDQFLSLIQSIESFHRCTFEGKYLPDEDYKEVYDTLLKAIPEGVGSELKDRLMEYLKYGNEFSLRKRLKEIFEEYKEILDKFIENKKDFIEKVVNTRNYFTHHGMELKEHAASGEDLYHLTQKLRMCLEICLLTEIGFSSEEIKVLISKNNRYKQYFT